MKDNTYRTPLTSCPQCRHAIDSAGEWMGDNVKPKAGDFSICIRCAGINVFNADLSLRMAVGRDLDGMTEQDRRMINRARQLLRQMNRKEN